MYNIVNVFHAKYLDIIDSLDFRTVWTVKIMIFTTINNRISTSFNNQIDMLSCQNDKVQKIEKVDILFFLFWLYHLLFQ